MSEQITGKIPDAFRSSVSKTFSEMAFIDVATSDEEDEVVCSHIVHIAFSEPNEGEITLLLPLSVKRTIVENVYGAEWESMKATEIDDCLLELLNVLAGDFLTELYGDGVHRDLSLPQLLFDESEPARRRSRTFHFDAEGEPFKARLRIELAEPASSAP